MSDSVIPMRAVILAGGRGTRLAPYTTVLPKPLMPIGEMPILELLIRQLRKAGIREVSLAVGHLASIIQAYFGDGERFGVSIAYSMEDQPLGTAGPLKLIEGLSSTFMVMNGDLLTDLDIAALIHAHRRSRAAGTLGLYARDVHIDLGVLRTDDEDRVREYIEKPTYHYDVSMGIYVFEPRVLDLIPNRERFDLPELIRKLIGEGEEILAYRHRGYWLDIGRPDDYQRAQDEFESIRQQIL